VVPFLTLRESIREKTGPGPVVVQTASRLGRLRGKNIRQGNIRQRNGSRPCLFPIPLPNIPLPIPSFFGFGSPRCDPPLQLIEGYIPPATYRNLPQSLQLSTLNPNAFGVGPASQRGIFGRQHLPFLDALFSFDKHFFSILVEIGRDCSTHTLWVSPRPSR